MTNKPPHTTLVGVAGEYFVAAELSQRGCIAAITLRNSRGIDIVASRPDGSRSISLQVKTNSTGKAAWILGAKSESFHSDRHFYVLVALRGTEQRPHYHVVPSRDVAEAIFNSHRAWLEKPKADGSPRKDSTMRKFEDPEGKYRDAWHLLGL